MKRTLFLYIFLGLAVLICARLIYDNLFIQVKHIRLPFDNIKSEVRLLHISDLHGRHYKRLIKKCVNQHCDALLITGDLPDDENYDSQYIASLISSINLPTYCILGNHEYRFDTEQYIKDMEGLGVTMLRNESVQLKIGDNEITLLGLDEAEGISGDSSFHTATPTELQLSLINALPSQSIIMTHYPECVALKGEMSYNNCSGNHLFLSGHAHGGQIRLPFTQGLYSPGQGILPKFTKGLYCSAETGGHRLIVSPGCGGSPLLPRLLNPPTVYVLELYPSDAN